MGRQVHTQRTPCEGDIRYRSGVFTSQGKPRKLGQSHGTGSLTAPRKSQPWEHLDLELPMPRTEKQCISVAYASHPWSFSMAALAKESGHWCYHFMTEELRTPESRQGHADTQKTGLTLDSSDTVTGCLTVYMRQSEVSSRAGNKNHIAIYSSIKHDQIQRLSGWSVLSLI